MQIASLIYSGYTCIKYSVVIIAIIDVSQSKPFNVTISNSTGETTFRTSVYDDPPNDGTFTYDIRLQQPLRAQYIRIKKAGTAHEIMTICEVEVFERGKIMLFTFC